MRLARAHVIVQPKVLVISEHADRLALACQLHQATVDKVHLCKRLALEVDLLAGCEDDGLHLAHQVQQRLIRHVTEEGAARRKPAVDGERELRREMERNAIEDALLERLRPM